jgi:hypothetical protein
MTAHKYGEDAFTQVGSQQGYATGGKWVRFRENLAAQRQPEGMERGSDAPTHATPKTAYKMSGEEVSTVPVKAAACDAQCRGHAEVQGGGWQRGGAGETKGKVASVRGSVCLAMRAALLLSSLMRVCIGCPTMSHTQLKPLSLALTPPCPLPTTNSDSKSQHHFPFVTFLGGPTFLLGARASPGSPGSAQERDSGTRMGDDGRAVAESKVAPQAIPCVSSSPGGVDVARTQVVAASTGSSRHGHGRWSCGDGSCPPWLGSAHTWRSPRRRRGVVGHDVARAVLVSMVVLGGSGAGRHWGSGDFGAMSSSLSTLSGVGPQPVQAVVWDRERRALMDLYASTQGASWLGTVSGWQGATGPGPCESDPGWTGVTCDVLSPSPTLNTSVT